MTLTRDQALGFLLSRQGLIDPFPDPITALDRLIVVQTQYAASLPTALAARCRKITPSWHSRAENKDTLKSWSIRSTLHAHTRANHALLMSAVGPGRVRDYREWLQTLGFSEEDVAELEREVLAAVSDGPKTRPELHERVPILQKIPYAGWGMDLKLLAYQGKLRFIISDKGQTRFAKYDPPDFLEQDEAVSSLLRAYLSAYGPATSTDFAAWTGLKVPPVRRAFEANKDLLQELQVEGLEGKRWLLTGDVDEAMHAPKPKPVRLLAKFDPLAMGHKVRDLWLDPKERPHVFRIAGQVEAVVLVKGRAAATWRVDVGRTVRIRVEPFRKLSTIAVGQIESEAARMAKRLWKAPLEEVRFLDQV